MVTILDRTTKPRHPEKAIYSLEEGLQFYRIHFNKADGPLTKQGIFNALYGELIKVAATHFGINGPYGIPSIAWGFVNAYPLRWEVGPLDSMDNKILTESLEFSYNYFERVNLNGLGAATKLAQFAARLAL